MDSTGKVKTSHEQRLGKMASPYPSLIGMCGRSGRGGRSCDSQLWRGWSCSRLRQRCSRSCSSRASGVVAGEVAAAGASAGMMTVDEKEGSRKKSRESDNTGELAEAKGKVFSSKTT